MLCKVICLNLYYIMDWTVVHTSYIQCDDSVLDRHSRLATLLHKLGDSLKSEGRAVSVAEKPRPLSLSSGAIADVEIGKVGDFGVSLCFAVYLVTHSVIWN